MYWLVHEPMIDDLEMTMENTIRKKIIRDFSKAAKTYDQYAILQRMVADRLFDHASVIWSKKTNQILDIGAGTGYFHELLRKNKIYNNLTQVDISHEMCKIAANYASPPEYGETYTCVADMHELPFANDTFDGIFSSMTLQWAMELEDALIAAKGVLAKGGTFTFSTVEDGSLHELSMAFSASGHTTQIHNFLTESDIESQIKNSGFTVKEIFSETTTLFYQDIYSLLHAIKGVGASYKTNNQTGLKGKKYFVEIESAYRDKFFHEKGLPLSWNIVYAVVTNDAE